MFDASLMSGLGPRFWYYLSCFAYVVHFKSYSKAAECLDVSQSSLTKAVQALEKQLKVSLLLRGGRRSLDPTPQGDQIYAFSVAFFKDLFDLKHCLQGLETPQPYTLSLSIPEWIFCEYLFEPLRQCKHHHPDIKIAFESSIDWDPIIHCATESIMRLTINPRVGWIQKPLLQYRLALYASADYLKAHVLPKHLGDLNKHTCLYWQSEDPKLFEIMNWHRSEKDLRVLRSYSSETLIKMAQMGLGVISGFKASSHLRGHGLIEFAESISQHYAPTITVYFECSAVNWHQTPVQDLYRYLAGSLRIFDTIPIGAHLE